MGEYWQIILTSFQVCLSSSLIASLFAIPFGLWLGFCQNKLAKRLRPLVSTLAGLPPVIAGVTIYLLLSNAGPLGSYRLLYTKTAIIIAQILIIFPLVSAAIYPLVLPIRNIFKETCLGLNLDRFTQFKLLIKELRTGLISAYLLGFGRAMAEVGAVMMVGGNIRYKTRVMTTAIVLETNQGNYEMALVLGLVLLVLSMGLNYLVQISLKEHRYDPVS